MAKRVQKEPDHWSEIVGMPDQWDKKNIQAIINNFKRRKFVVEGQVITGKIFIDLEVADAKRMHQSEDGFNPYNIKAKGTESRAVMAMPIELDKIIKEAYPTMFRDKNHFSWFIKNFPEFRIASKF